MSYEGSIKHSSIIEVVITVQLDAAGRDRQHPVVPCELPDGIQSVYVDDSASRRVIALDKAGAIHFWPDTAISRAARAARLGTLHELTKLAPVAVIAETLGVLPHHH